MYPEIELPFVLEGAVQLTSNERSFCVAVTPLGALGDPAGVPDEEEDAVPDPWLLTALILTK